MIETCYLRKTIVSQDQVFQDKELKHTHVLRKLSIEGDEVKVC